VRLAAVTAILLFCPAAASGASVAPHQPGSVESISAKVIVQTATYAKPGFDRRRTGRLKTYTDWSKGPQKLLVLKSARNHQWVKLRTAERPNNSSAWVPTNRLILSKNPWRVHVYKNRHLVKVFRSGEPVRRFKAVIGEPATPTPAGLFAVYEKIRQPNPREFVGPYVLHLTAHSNVLHSYDGGPGRVALHGRSGDSLEDPLGTSKSHGCVRINNTMIRYLNRKLAIGTPVKISG